MSKGAVGWPWKPVPSMASSTTSAAVMSSSSRSSRGGATTMGNARTLGVDGHHVSEVALELVGLHGGDDRTPRIPARRAIRGNPAVAAVIAIARQHHDVLGVLDGHDLLCGCRTGATHELGEAHAHLGERQLDLTHVFDVVPPRCAPRLRPQAQCLARSPCPAP